MFDIGWTEMLVVVCVAIIVVGPKDLPKMLRTFGRAMKSVRGLASDFQKQFEDAVKEADLDEVKDLASGKGFSPLEDIKKSATSFEKDVKEQMAAKSKEGDEAKGLPKPVADKLAAMDAKADAASAKTAAKPTTASKASAKKASAKPAAAKKSAAKSTTSKTKTAAKAPAKTASKSSGTSSTTSKKEPARRAAARKPATEAKSATRKPASKKPAKSA